MYLDGAADPLKPEQDTANARPNWYVSGYGRFDFSSEADAKSAIELAKEVARAERSNIARAVDNLIG